MCHAVGMTQPSNAPGSILAPEKWAALLKAHADFQAKASPTYDEVLTEVAGRIRESRSIGKSDIGALVFWKRLRADTPWVTDIMSLPEHHVRATTAKAVAAVNDHTVRTPQAASNGRRALSDLPGFSTGDALASALLFASAPHRMAVYDRRAQTGLQELDLSLSAKPGRYSRYMELVDALCTTARKNNHDWIPRDVDIALYQLGDPQRKNL
ncbi:hypothetical protein ANMWB30_23500 [Arthrobacter sp. MWB30]|nr:hypothetical protein ANMWB30_23500 [Arthrobacter sp. MWB30]